MTMSRLLPFGIFAMLVAGAWQLAQPAATTQAQQPLMSAPADVTGADTVTTRHILPQPRTLGDKQPIKFSGSGF